MPENGTEPQAPPQAPPSSISVDSLLSEIGRLHMVVQVLEQQLGQADAEITRLNSVVEKPKAKA